MIWTIICNAASEEIVSFFPVVIQPHSRLRMLKDFCDGQRGLGAFIQRIGQGWSWQAEILIHV